VLNRHAGRIESSFLCATPIGPCNAITGDRGLTSRPLRNEWRPARPSRACVRADCAAL
jgi:hypothetical protein